MAEAISDQSWNLTALDLLDTVLDNSVGDDSLDLTEAAADIENKSEMADQELCDSTAQFLIGSDNLENLNYLYYEIDISNARRNSDTPSVASTSTSASLASYVSDTDALAMFPIRVSTTLWKDNPEQDPFNTFSVSEDNLTKIIDYLENVSARGKNQKGQEVSENVMNSMQEDFRGAVSDKVTFILDTYYSMYMTR